MSFPVSISWPDIEDEPLTGVLHLAGAPVPAIYAQHGVCVGCNYPLSRLRDDPATGDDEYGDPANGNHYGIVVFAHGGGEAHLRCLLDGEARVVVNP